MSAEREGAMHAVIRRYAEDLSASAGSGDGIPRRTMENYRFLTASREDGGA